MNVASVDKNKAPWVISTADQPPALEIVLRRQTVIISWNQFVYAEGAGHVDHKVEAQTLPRALEWLWQGYKPAR